MSFVLTLSEFTLRALRQSAGGRTTVGVERALAALRGRIERDEWVPPVPRFMVVGSDEVEDLRELAVEIEPGSVLLAEARRQGVKIGRLATHAVVLYLAALDRGRT